MNNQPGIYKITCIANGKIYIGSSQAVRQRTTNHKSDLKLGKHQNKHLQAAYNKYGKESLTFELVEYCSIEILLEREQFYIDLHDSYKKGFNRMPQAASPRGRKYTEEESAKRKLTRGPAWNKGRARTQEEKIAHSQAMTGREAWNKGVDRTEERKLEQRTQAKGKKAVLALDKISGLIVEEYESLGDASRKLGFSRDILSYRCLNFEKRQYTYSTKHNIPYDVVYKEDFNNLKQET